MKRLLERADVRRGRPLWRAAIVAAALAMVSGDLGAKAAPQAAREVALSLAPGDVIPTGNDWIALPSIRADDGALQDFNVISMRYRGLVEMAGPAGKPLMAPFLEREGVRRPLSRLSWSLRDYWIPTATMEADGVRLRLTYVAPPGSHPAIIRFELTNLTDHPLRAAPGMVVDWGRTNRVTYSPEPLKGAMTMSPTPIDTDMEVFNYGTDDTHLAWGFAYVDSKGELNAAGQEPGLTARREVDLAPHQTVDVHFLIGVGLEEYSAAYAMRVLNKRIARYGLNGVLEQAAADARRHTRTTGEADLDQIMNRNLLFSTYYAWGRAIDTEDFVGVTSRSNRYYVSAAYWDRDALLWSFPALLDTDQDRARLALDYVLQTQARNIGVHSRFIDGVVLEDGLELDELAAPLIALTHYVKVTHDMDMVLRHQQVVAGLVEKILAQRDPKTGLYETFQDAQDEYVAKPYSIYDNVLTWRALLDLAALKTSQKRDGEAKALRDRAAELKAAILRYGVLPGAHGAGGPIFAANVDGKAGDFTDVPPGSLMKLPYLGFISEQAPLFRRTYDWLHSQHYAYSYFDQPLGLPGSYRLPFTTSWEVADHLRLKAGKAQALKILRQSPWDGGVITEGVRPDTGSPDHQGLAFATAAGYVGHTICEQFCLDKR